MPKQYTFMLDDSCVDWYDYHFEDTILRNDIVWRTWRAVLQRYLSADQLRGRACGLCGVAITPDLLTLVEYVGGYKILICAKRCETTLERDMRETVEQIEAIADEHKKNSKS